jgi:hypothetical protein
MIYTPVPVLNEGGGNNGHEIIYYFGTVYSEVLHVIPENFLY